ncbi:DUF2306 domain-containing protein [Oceaniserpentilla sp. 4NH20-0058]|uniref:DUF2306 domain-containing protein n=1 Tax=Oceaniserpentilla sp. 4NH20-0058 TaxID=3127660 RepID=UPI003108AD52
MSIQIMIHLISIIPALLLGIFILTQEKGTHTHKLVGKTWVVLMLTSSLVSFFIQTNGGFSWIHILSIISISSISVGIWAIRNNKLIIHKGCMIGAFTGTFIAGIVATVSPGRIVHNFLFGG